MKQYEMLLAEIERRKKVLTVLGEGFIVGQGNETEYKLLCELEEFAKGLTLEVTTKEYELDRAQIAAESAWLKSESHVTKYDAYLDGFNTGVKWLVSRYNALDAKIRWWGDKYYFVQSDFFDATKKQLQADEEVKVIILKQKEQ